MKLSAEEIAGVIADELLEATALVDQNVGIALSGGVDSCSVLAALLWNSVRPTVVSYTPETHESTDFKMARAAAEQYGLPFVPVLVSMDPEDLEDDVRFLTGLGFKTKLQVESMTPMIHIQRVAAEAGVETLFTGDQADGFFINNNWMARNFDRARGIPGPLRFPVSEDEDPWRIDQLRDIYWNEDRSCSGPIQRMGLEHGLAVSVPYRSERIREAFVGTLWSDVNLPRFKEPIRMAFDEWFQGGLRTLSKPVNLHRGDSYFAERMGKILMDQEHLAGPWRTPTGLYAAISRGDA